MEVSVRGKHYLLVKCFFLHFMCFCHRDSHIDLVIVNISVSSDKVSREKKEVTNILDYCLDTFQHLEPFCIKMFKGQFWGW